MRALKRLSILATLILFLGGGCSPFSSRGALLAQAYHEIDTHYISPVQVSSLAMAATSTLNGIDGSVRVVSKDGSLVLTRDARVVQSFPAPAPSDWRGWGKATAELSSAAADASPLIQRLPANALDEALIDGALGVLDAYSRYVPPKSAEPADIAPSTLFNATNLDGQSAPPAASDLQRSVQSKYGIALIKIESFRSSTGQTVRRKLENATRQLGPLRGVILDLRDNPGGEVASSLQVVDLFLDHGAIVTFEFPNQANIQVARALLDRGGNSRVPVIVLINRNSASASEIVAAALQDNHRALVIGSPSYGKGTSQKVFNLVNGGELFVTSAYMRAPAGYLLDHHGVLPDICTSLPDNAKRQQWFRALQSRPRTSLSEAQWSEFRERCQATRTAEKGDQDLALATDILRMKEDRYR